MLRGPVIDVTPSCSLRCARRGPHADATPQLWHDQKTVNSLALINITQGSTFTPKAECFDLQLHKDKSQMIRTGHTTENELALQGQRLGTFKFLDFIGYFAKSKNGYWVPKYRSCGKRFSAKLKGLKAHLANNLNTPNTLNCLSKVVTIL